MSNLSIVQGDSRSLEITVQDPDGNAFDLTGYTMMMTVKSDIGFKDSQAEIQEEAVIATPATGIGEISLSPKDTSIPVKVYKYDIQISDGTNNVYTIIKGKLNIEEQVTRTP